MKKFTILFFLTSCFSYAQVTLTSPITVTEHPTKSNGRLTFNFGLSDNFSRGYLYTYLSKDQFLSPDDESLGSRRIFNSMFKNGKTKEIRYGIGDIPIGTYYIILKAHILSPSPSVDYVFSSSKYYCFNMDVYCYGPSGGTTTGGGKPDLRVKDSNVLITSECFNCNASLAYLESDRHIISKEAGILTIQQVIIDNIGKAEAPSSKLNFYLSTDKTLESTDYKFDKSVNVKSISPNGSILVSNVIFGSDFPDNKEFGDYYVLMKVDGDDKLNELNEDNNITAIPIKYRQNLFSSKTSRMTRETRASSKIEETIPFKVFDFDGNEIRHINYEKKKEKEVLSQLGRGLYIIKYENGTSKKVIINDIKAPQ